MSEEERADTDLLARYRAGDATAFEELYARHKHALYHHARAIVRDDGLAEDLTNEVFLELARQAEVGRSGSVSLGPFLHTVLRRRAIDCLRSSKTSRRREQEFSRDWVRARTQAVDPAQVTELNRALSELPEEQMEALLLHLYAGMSFQEVADAVGESINTVASRYRYALKKLAEHLGGRS